MAEEIISKSVAYNYRVEISTGTKRGGMPLID
jgi:hypothetical protein